MTRSKDPRPVVHISDEDYQAGAKVGLAKVVEPKPSPVPEVVDLFEALKKSLQEAQARRDSEQ